MHKLHLEKGHHAHVVIETAEDLGLADDGTGQIRTRMIDVADNEDE